MSNNEEELYMLNNRDEAESKRLEEQHALWTKVAHGQLLHSSIPLTDIQTIADVATGTGAWLRDFSHQLERTSSQTTPRYYHGFDISPSQFPSPSDPATSKLHFSLHNVLEPFPAEHIGRYDIVNVRLLVLALSEEQLHVAAKNIVQLLKPGGHIQWSEFTTKSAMSKPPYSTNPIFAPIRDYLIPYFSTAGFSSNAPATISTALADPSLHIDDLQVHDFNMSTLTDPVAIQAACTWWEKAVGSLLPVAMMRMGKVKTVEEAEGTLESVLKGFEEAAGKDGDRRAPDFVMGVVVGRRA